MSGQHGRVSPILKMGDEGTIFNQFYFNAKRYEQKMAIKVIEGVVRIIWA